jgi:hypothetical protein
MINRLKTKATGNRMMNRNTPIMFHVDSQELMLAQLAQEFARLMPKTSAKLVAAGKNRLVASV